MVSYKCGVMLLPVSRGRTYLSERGEGGGGGGGGCADISNTSICGRAFVVAGRHRHNVIITATTFGCPQNRRKTASWPSRISSFCV